MSKLGSKGKLKFKSPQLHKTSVILCFTDSKSSTDAVSQTHSLTVSNYCAQSPVIIEAVNQINQIVPTHCAT